MHPSVNEGPTSGGRQLVDDVAAPAVVREDARVRKKLLEACHTGNRNAPFVHVDWSAEDGCGYKDKGHGRGCGELQPATTAGIRILGDCPGSDAGQQDGGHRQQDADADRPHRKETRSDSDERRDLGPARCAVNAGEKRDAHEDEERDELDGVEVRGLPFRDGRRAEIRRIEEADGIRQACGALRCKGCREHRE